MKSLFILIQFLVPQRLLSRTAGWLAESRLPWLKNLMIDQFIRIFGVDMSEAADADPHTYANFNAFFARALRQDVRPVDSDPKHAVCPADGSVSQLGEVRDGRIFQAKGRDYSLVELLGGRRGEAEPFRRGRFATIYLSPRDYHRVHMPVDGTLLSMTHVPGELFSVNDVTASRVDRLFARNERLICHFDTPAGPMAMVLVGAMIVASVETVWAGQVTPVPRRIRTVDYRQPREKVSLKKGEEMGHFKLGSTVILLFGEDRIQWLERYEAGSRTRMGEALGTLQV